ncbi:MAG TPA: GNAT family N-acetyltransferase [Actinophytocola sp.]|uniref:GNAT family N-acetyltransferase n=1 Tax=Actinophytocola sp. TaxID=1872138 RepID=UPI002DDCE1F9|nr:GNAT family N-acetyltransferase [Actinophytocola sp.]HEV2782148.1 GNAT family N-acetyltransferase [Actinophytocola sp.]
MSDLTIRLARPAELDAVGALTLRAYQADGYFANGVKTDYAAELSDARTRADEGELLVAVDAEDRLLGTVTMARPGTRYAEVSRAGELEFRMLAVDPDARRRGVGLALVQAVLDRARELGLPRVVLSSHEKMTPVHGLYQRLGFSRLPERDWSPVPGVRLIAFELDL